MRLLASLLLFAACMGSARAQSDERLQIGGSYAFYAGLRTDGAPDLLTARNRAELRIGFDYDRGRILLRPRLDYDALGERLDGDLVEAYIDVFFSRVDLRLGRQPIVWGKTDGTFVTDLLAPLDLREFLAQPFDDLRLGVTAANATLYGETWRATGIVIPRRPTSRLPERGSPWYPLPPDVFGVPISITEPARQDSTLGGAETAVRLTYTGVDRTDIALLWINGFNRLPAFRKQLRLRLGLPPDAAIEIVPAYERRQVIGVTFETLALEPFVLRGETAYHTSYLLDQPIEIPQTLPELLDEETAEAIERGFLIEKPFVQSALGIERAFGAHLFRVQALGSLVLGWNERVAQDRFEPSLTGFWNGRFRRETITTQVFAFYNLGADYWLNPSVTYAVRDALNATLGLQVFGGPDEDRQDLAGLLREPAFSFATYDRNDFLYLRVTYSF